MRILLTGCDGYIGSRLGPRLLREGHDVRGYDTGFYRSGWLYDPLETQPEVLTGDVRRLSVDDLRGFDAVVHLAELSNDPLGQLDPELTFRVNHQGSVTLARRAREAGVSRFVYASSCSVYGAGTGDWKDETSPPDPRTAYAQCKVSVERELANLTDERFAPTMLRNATAYGPSPRMRFDIVLNNLAGLAWTTGEIALVSDGSPWRPLVHVEDIGEAIVQVLQGPREAIAGETFNVGDDGQNFQVREIAAVVSEVFPGCRLTVGPSQGDDRSYRVRFDKIRRHLPEFRCRRTLLSGARELHDLFGRIELTTEQFTSRHHTRLLQLQHLLASNQIDSDLNWTTGVSA